MRDIAKNEGPDLSSWTPHFENDPTLGFSITHNSSVKEDQKNLKDIFISVRQVPGLEGWKFQFQSKLPVPITVPVPNQTGV
jgi:hypothetical protein